MLPWLRVISYKEGPLESDRKRTNIYTEQKQLALSTDVASMLKYISEDAQCWQQSKPLVLKARLDWLPRKPTFWTTNHWLWRSDWNVYQENQRFKLSDCCQHWRCEKHRKNLKQTRAPIMVHNCQCVRWFLREQYRYKKKTPVISPKIFAWSVPGSSIIGSIWHSPTGLAL